MKNKFNLVISVLLLLAACQPVSAPSVEPTQTALPPTATALPPTEAPTATLPVRSVEILPTDTAPAPASICPQGCTEEKPGCDIKGNINSDGEKIYHTAVSSSYKNTKIDPSKGERWFCSVEEAQAAGWRPPR